MSRRKSDPFQNAANQLRLFVSPQAQPSRDILMFCSMERIKIDNIFTGTRRVHLFHERNDGDTMVFAAETGSKFRSDDAI